MRGPKSIPCGFSSRAREREAVGLLPETVPVRARAEAEVEDLLDRLVFLDAAIDIFGVAALERPAGGHRLLHEEVESELRNHCGVSSSALPTGYKSDARQDLPLVGTVGRDRGRAVVGDVADGQAVESEVVMVA